MKLEDRVNNNERKIKTVEEAIVLLTQLTRSHTEQLEKSVFDRDEMRAAQRHTDEKINMLIDAQIRSEDKSDDLQTAISKLTELLEKSDNRANKFDKGMEKLAEAQAKSDEKMAKLVEIVKSAQKRINKINEN